MSWASFSCSFLRSVGTGISTGLPLKNEFENLRLVTVNGSPPPPRTRIGRRKTAYVGPSSVELCTSQCRCCSFQPVCLSFPHLPVVLKHLQISLQNGIE